MRVHLLSIFLVAVAILGCASARGFSTDDGGDGQAGEKGRIGGNLMVSEVDVADFEIFGLRAREVPAGEYSFTGPGQWEDFLEKYQDGPPPEIDFEQHALVAVFLGSRPNSGYSVAIVGASEQGGETIVRVVESLPSPGMMYAQVISYPYAVARIPASGKPVRFATAKKKRDGHRPPRGMFMFAP